MFLAATFQAIRHKTFRQGAVEAFVFPAYNAAKVGCFFTDVVGHPIGSLLQG
jgi:hypothetical protein